MNKLVILITGASSGIGYETARMLAEKGYKVYGAARRAERMEPLRQYGVIPIVLDVTSGDSAKAAVDCILHKEGRIDILVNNAGYGELGPIETTDIENAQHQMDVNVLGLARMTQLVLPHMRSQHSGRIVNVASIAGHITFCFAGWYNASKYAVEALSDATRMEVKRYGVDVAIVEPGGVYSDWGRIAAKQLRKASADTVYEENAGRTANVFEMMYGRNPYNLMTSTEKAAKYVCKAATSPCPKTRYAFGVGNATMRFLHTVLPDRWFDALITTLFHTFG
ncbi:MAG: oxidoreductase [Prevotellaceae bacterium]|nr:oxidoreductase [Prevotellaceae bacterium]